MNKTSVFCKLAYYKQMGYYPKMYDLIHHYDSFIINNHNPILYKHPTVNSVVNNIYKYIRYPIYQTGINALKK